MVPSELWPAMKPRMGGLARRPAYPRETTKAMEEPAVALRPAALAWLF